jgi:thiamine-phosphate pyrophosphorylase
MNKNFQIYFFLEELNTINISILKKLKNVSLIYRNYVKKNYLENAISISNFTKKYRFKLFIANDWKLVKKINANGIYIPNFNKQSFFKNNNSIQSKYIIGSAHSIPEIHMKIKQGCTSILLSPVFKTTSHPNTQNLGIIKFSNLCQNISQQTKLIALGGINETNIKKLFFLNISGIALKSFLNKPQTSKSLRFLNLIAGTNLIR